MNYTVYTVHTGDDQGNEWQVAMYTDESAATQAADDMGGSARITEMLVPLPEVVVVVERGLVSSVTTVDGLELDAVVRDYSPDGDGEFDEYTV